jgi:hypothetical protein
MRLSLNQALITNLVTRGYGLGRLKGNITDSGSKEQEEETESKEDQSDQDQAC